MNTLYRWNWGNSPECSSGRKLKENIQCILADVLENRAQEQGIIESDND